MKFIVYTCDKADGLSIRKGNRDAHLAFLGAEADVKVLSAGPWLDDAGETMKGSLLIVEAETLSIVKEWLKNDPYAKAGLPENVTVHPFIWALGAP